MTDIEKLAADKANIIAVLDYCSGPDSCNSVYLGSYELTAIYDAVRCPRIENSRQDLIAAINKADRKLIDRLLVICGPVIDVMLKHPTTTCPTCGTHGIPVDKVAGADKRLSGAAPDLLAALKALFASYKELADSGDAGFWKLEDCPEGKQALEAIAKAEGGAS